MNAALRRLKRLESAKGTKRIEIWVALDDGRVRNVGTGEIKTRAGLTDAGVAYAVITEAELHL